MGVEALDGNFIRGSVLGVKIVNTLRKKGCDSLADTLEGATKHADGTEGSSPQGSGGGSKGGIDATNRTTNGLPDNPSQLGHVFGDRPGHLPDTPQNRQLLVDTSNNPANSLGANRFGNEVHVSTRPDGSQIWVETRNGIIQNGGVNNPPRVWVDGEGLR